MLNGIDVYEGNNISDWNKVKNSGISVVIQKATQNCFHVDNLLYYRIPKIKQAGLYIGYYHFAQYNSTNPIGEAQHFLQTIKGQPLDTCLWVDVEIDDKWNKQTAINYTNQFVSYVQSQGYKIGLYTGLSFYENYLKGNIPNNIPLWIARYSNNPPYTYPTYSWQYSESGQVSGISGQSDMDKFTNNILLSNSQQQPTYKQPNNFCKNQKGGQPILPKFITIGHTEFKELPDDNSRTTGTREAGFEVNVFGKVGNYYLVNNGMPQYVKISSLKATSPLSIEKVIKVIDWNNISAYENPSDVDKAIDTYKYQKILPVYTDTFGYFLTCGSNQNLKWINNNNQIEQIYPNAFISQITTDSKPLLINFIVNVDNASVKKLPCDESITIKTLPINTQILIYAKCGKYYLINNDINNPEFIKISDLKTRESLPILRNVRCCCLEGSYARENPSTKIKNNGLIPFGKKLSVYMEFNNHLLLNGNNENLQWSLKDNFEDIIQ